jgi:hypothetical protein
MIPQYESTGEWVQRIEEQKRSEPSKKRKKKPTGILKDLSELKRYELFKGTVETKFKDLTKEGEYVRWSDVEAIINKYLNP